MLFKSDLRALQDELKTLGFQEGAIFYIIVCFKSEGVLSLPWALLEARLSMKVGNDLNTALTCDVLPKQFLKQQNKTKQKTQTQKPNTSRGFILSFA